MRSLKEPKLRKRSVIGLIILFLFVGRRITASAGITQNDENACCTLGQVQGAQSGHCLTLNVSSALSPAANQDGALFACQLTAKMCCLKGQQGKLCKRVAQEMLQLEPVDALLGSSMLQNRQLIRISINATELSSLLVSQYSCDLKRNTDALCCLGCNLGLLWAVQRLAKLNGELPIETITKLDTESWCLANGTEHSVGRTVSESLGFTQCCTESLGAIHRNIRWCELKPAPCAHRCYEAVSESTRVQCSCYEGYRLGPDGRSCLDVDECEELTHNCDGTSETCSNTPGAYQCLTRKYLGTPKPEMFPKGNCSKGYYFNSSESRCKDIDECRHSLHDCSLKTQVCRNLLGSFICLDIGNRQCPSGFRASDTPSPFGAQTNCLDVDECKEEAFDCDRVREDCENFIGSYTCEAKLDSKSRRLTTVAPSTSTTSGSTDPTSCTKGYRFVRFSYQCEDIDECRIGQHDCNLSKEKCVNFPGTYECVPLAGRGSSEESSQSGEAGNSQPGSSAVVRAANRRAIICQSGYERNEEFDICEDLDECNQILSPCSTTSYCQNTIGSYVCHCKTGYIKTGNDSNLCEDVDECTKGLHNCVGTLRCLNTIGSFECAPAPVTRTSTSSPPAERSQRHGEFETASLNSPQSELACESGERILNGECRTVDCGSGFIYNSTLKRCHDLNECLRYSPCKATEKCTNTVGSYRCTLRCNSGYRSSHSGTACEDVDECATTNAHCPPNQVCKNRPGGFTCQCPPGYVGPNSRGACEDIDECSTENVCEQNQACHNTPGSYKCQCKAGFREESRKPFQKETGPGSKRCVDIDECESGSNRCEHLCYNYAGSFKCACKSGFQLNANGYSCDDVDECIVFAKEGGRRQARSQSGLVAASNQTTDNVCYYKCINEPGSFRCVCPPGYESLSDGQICKDIDECETERLCQSENEYCLNVRGSYRCQVINCPSGYYLEPTGRKCLRHMDGLQGFVDMEKPLSYSYNYLSIVSNLPIPSYGYLDLVQMSGPIFSVTGIKFDLSLKSARPHRWGIERATREHFLLRRPEYNKIIVALAKSIPGPQDIELELHVSLYSEGTMGGSTTAVISLVVSEFEF